MIASGPGRKIKHVSDVAAMGTSAPMPAVSPYMQPTTGPPVVDPMMQNYNNIDAASYATPLQPMQPTQGGIFNNGSMATPHQNYGYAAPSPPPQQPPQYSSLPGIPPIGGTQFGSQPQQPGVAGQFPPQFAMFQQPIVQDMAMQYGQHLADQGKQLVENQLTRWVPVSKLKYYFAVDNNYVIHKLRLLFFPFTHRVS